MKMENLGFYEYLESSGVGLFYLGMSNLCKNEQIYCPLDFRKEIENLSKIERKVDFEEYLWDYVGPKMNFHAVKDKIGIDMDCISEKEIKEKARTICKIYNYEMPRRIRRMSVGERYSVIWLYPLNYKSIGRLEENWLSRNERIEQAGNPNIYDYGLSIRALNCLEKAGLTKIKDIANMAKEDLLSIRGLGETTAREIKKKLLWDTFGLKFKQIRKH